MANRKCLLGGGALTYRTVPAASRPEAATGRADNVNQLVDEASPEAVFETLHELMHLHRAQRQRAIEAAGLGAQMSSRRVMRWACRDPVTKWNNQPRRADDVAAAVRRSWR
jgi:hypothetical protein